MEGLKRIDQGGILVLVGLNKDVNRHVGPAEVKAGVGPVGVVGGKSQLQELCLERLEKDKDAIEPFDIRAGPFKPLMMAAIHVAGRSDLPSRKDSLKDI